MRAAYPLWFALEEEAGEKLYVKTGGLDFGFPNQETFQVLKQSVFVFSDGFSYYYEWV